MREMMGGYRVQLELARYEARMEKERFMDRWRKAMVDFAPARLHIQIAGVVQSQQANPAQCDAVPTASPETTTSEDGAQPNLD